MALDQPQVHRRSRERVRLRERMRPNDGDVLDGIVTTAPDGTVTRTERVVSLDELRAEQLERESIRAARREAWALRESDPAAAAAMLDRVHERERAVRHRRDAQMTVTVLSAPQITAKRPPHQRPHLRPARARGAGRPRAAATRSSSRSGDSGDDGPASSDDGDSSSSASAGRSPSLAPHRLPSGGFA